MTAGDAEDQADDGQALQQEGAADDDENEARELHIDPSMELKGRVARITELHWRPSGRRFYAKLERQLGARGIAGPVPAMAGVPPCFDAAGVSYETWLAQASITDLPYRRDMPAEPNYCHDCVPAFKAEMQKIGACRFPKTVFIVEDNADVEDNGVIGVGRLPIVGPEQCRLFQELTDE